MSTMSDNDLREQMAEMLYHRSVAGTSRDEAPPWLACPDAIQGHWRDIARAALNMVRTADGAG